MKKQSGFSLIELVLSLCLLSVLLAVFLKLQALEHGRSQSFLEKQDLMAYTDVLDWTLKNTKREKTGTWYGFQDVKTRERKFVRWATKEKVCCAEVKEEGEFYNATLRKKTSKNARTAPIKFFILKSS